MKRVASGGLLLVLFAFVGAALVVTNAPILEVSIAHRDHAVKKHGGEAIAVRRACDNGGRMHTYRSRSWRTPDKFYEICRLDDGRVGIRVREWSKKLCRWFERTSFLPADGTYMKVMEYVTAKATESSWSTVKDYSC